MKTYRAILVMTTYHEKYVQAQNVKEAQKFADQLHPMEFREIDCPFNCRVEIEDCN